MLYPNVYVLCPVALNLARKPLSNTFAEARVLSSDEITEAAIIIEETSFRSFDE